MKNIFKLGSVFMAIALLISTLLLSGVFASAEQKNLIVNGDFSDGLNGWTYSSYEDDWSVSGGKLIALANHGSKDDSLSPSFTEALKGETTYTLHVDISDLSGACVLRVNLDNNHEIADSPITATGDYTFTTYASTDLFKIKVLLPKNNSGATATFDNFILVEGDKIESETTATGAATETTASASETEATVTATATSASATETATETATSASATETATETATSASATETATETATSASATETATETATEAEPTATEAEKVFHAVDSWSDANGVGYTWVNPNGYSGQVQVYNGTAGTKGTWKEFVATWATLESNQYMEITFTGMFANASNATVTLDSRAWTETKSEKADFIVSATEEQIVARFYGPLTKNTLSDDPNIGLHFNGENLTAISNEANTHVTVTVFEEGEEPTTTATATETATEAEPTATATETATSASATETATETATSASETETSASETETSASETETSASESETSASETETTPSATVTASAATETGSETGILGDANGDGAVNMKDVLLARKYLAGIEVTINLDAADVNEDGSVNMKDILDMRKFLANLIDHFGA